jgi:hypothetical protein
MCQICDFAGAARDEVSTLETTDREEKQKQLQQQEQRDREQQQYYQARGDLAALRAYLNSCPVCAFAAEARAEISRLEDLQPKRRVSSSVLCGRDVPYVVDGTRISDQHRPFLGVWSGASWNYRICGALLVEKIEIDGTARIRYVYGSNPDQKFQWRVQSQPATIRDNKLSFQDEEGGNFVFDLTYTNTLRGHFTGKFGNRLDATLTRELSSVP